LKNIDIEADRQLTLKIVFNPVFSSQHWRQFRSQGKGQAQEVFDFDVKKDKVGIFAVAVVVEHVVVAYKQIKTIFVLGG
jgi:hypothetical protein